MPVPCCGQTSFDCGSRFSRGQGTNPVFDPLPAFSRMALLTAVAKLAVVRVFIGVACNTGSTHYCCVLALGRRLLVATFARHLAVRTIQPVARPAVVIEFPDRPGTGVVTIFAAHSELLFVFVFIFMTRKAILRCIFVTVCFVTILTRRSDMAPRQRKTRP